MLDSVPQQTPTRDRLIMAAADLMRRQSYSTVSVDDICRAAEVKKGTFYHHFPSKVELALATFDVFWAECRAEMAQCLSAPDMPAEDRLARYAAAVIEEHRETFAREGKVYGCPLCTTGNEMSAQDETIRQKIAAIYEDAVGLFVPLVREMPAFAGAGEAACRETARALLCYASGVEYQAKLANDPEVIARDLLPGLKRLIATPFPE